MTSATGAGVISTPAFALLVGLRPAPARAVDAPRRADRGKRRGADRAPALSVRADTGQGSPGLAGTRAIHRQGPRKQRPVPPDRYAAGLRSAGVGRGGPARPPPAEFCARVVPLRAVGRARGVRGRSVRACSGLKREGAGAALVAHQLEPMVKTAARLALPVQRISEPVPSTKPTIDLEQGSGSCSETCSGADPGRGPDPGDFLRYTLRGVCRRERGCPASLVGSEVGRTCRRTALASSSQKYCSARRRFPRDT